jgi:predicted Fe-Mo cluster-binding NifX family protein
MMIAIAAIRNSTNSPVNAHFGKSEWFCLFNPESGTHEFIPNTASQDPEMNGCQAAEYLIGQHVQTVIAGRFGAKVMESFRAANVQMIIPEGQRTISEIIQLVKSI